MGGRRKAKGIKYTDGDIRGIDTGKRVYPVSDADVDRVRESMRDNSQNTTKVNPDGMGKDAKEAIREFLKNN